MLMLMGKNSIPRAFSKFRLRIMGLRRQWPGFESWLHRAVGAKDSWCPVFKVGTGINRKLGALSQTGWSSCREHLQSPWAGHLAPVSPFPQL